MARPCRKNNEKAVNKIIARLTDDEFKIVEDARNLLDSNKSDFVRAAILKYADEINSKRCIKA